MLAGPEHATLKPAAPVLPKGRLGGHIAVIAMIALTERVAFSLAFPDADLIATTLCGPLSECCATGAW